MLNKKAKGEKEAFINFALNSGLLIKTSSIECMDPPQPDILCEIEGRGKVAFELFEIIDNGLYSNLMLKSNTILLLEKSYNNLETSIKEEFKELFMDAMISPFFEKSCTYKVRKKIIPEVLNKLNNPNMMHKMGDVSIRKFKKYIKYISISRGLENGPSFDSIEYAGFTDPYKIGNKVINDKLLHREYISDYPIELLAYYDKNIESTEKYWLPEIIKIIEENFEKSIFRKIWIYDIRNKLIKLVYPLVIS